MTLRSMAALAALTLLAAAPLACGDGDDGERPGARTESAPAAPDATTREPDASPGPGPGGGAPEPVGRTYTCRGEELRTQPAEEPVEVEPEIVEPGDGFTVTIAEPSAREAVVSLTGVGDEPIVVRAQPSGEGLVAALTMPEDASCGNKLLTVEGDVSAEASVAVRS